MPELGPGVAEPIPAPILASKMKSHLSDRGLRAGTVPEVPFSSPVMHPTLDVITVNWNAGELLRSCLDSVSSAEKTNFILRQYHLIDNASQDGSARNLDFPELPLQITYNQTNRGFGAACNQALAASQADLILLLNPDVRVYPDTLEKAVNFLAQPANRQVGILGVQLLDQHGEIGRSCARFPGPAHFFAQLTGLDQLAPGRFPSMFMREWDHRASRPVDHVMGSFYLARREVFETAGVFDERFFMYLEDLDLSLRAAQAGWQSFFLAEARAYHQFGGLSQRVKARRLFYYLHSRIRYGYKHFGRLAAHAHLAATLLVEPFPRLLQAALRDPRRGMLEVLKAYLLLWKRLPEVWRV